MKNFSLVNNFVYKRTIKSPALHFRIMMSHKPIQPLSFTCVALLYCTSLLDKAKKMLLPALIVCILINLSACSENNNEKEGSELAANDSALFYPVQEYFYSQLKTVDSNTSILLISTDTTGKKDSSVIDEPALTKLSKPFFENNISDPAIKRYYRESVFQDETTASYTFSYTSLNNSLPLQHLDVLLDTVTQRVKRVFITQTKTIADTSITEKMGWKTDQGFFINRIYHLPGNKETIQQINVVWKHNN